LTQESGLSDTKEEKRKAISKSDIKRISTEKIENRHAVTALLLKFSRYVGCSIHEERGYSLKGSAS
jgi:hypothetical protein